MFHCWLPTINKILSEHIMWLLVSTEKKKYNFSLSKSSEVSLELLLLTWENGFIRTGVLCQEGLKRDFVWIFWFIQFSWTSWIKLFLLLRTIDEICTDAVNKSDDHAADVFEEVINSVDTNSYLQLETDKLETRAKNGESLHCCESVESPDWWEMMLRTFWCCVSSTRKWSSADNWMCN